MLPPILEVPKVAGYASSPAYQNILSIPRRRVSPLPRVGAFPSLLTLILGTSLAISKPHFHHLRSRKSNPPSHTRRED